MVPLPAEGIVMSKKDEKPKRTKVHLSPELVAAFRAQGDDWEARIEAVLQAHLDKGDRGAGKSAGKVRAFFEDVAGPHMPQLEAVARDVAGKVAKDVAMAAAAAAMASWATNAAAAKAKAPPKADEPAA
jgi:BrnA antitoxin of type II toxin-antitoxin system